MENIQEVIDELNELNIRNLKNQEAIERIISKLLKELKGGEVSGDVKEEARQLLQSVDANALGIMEQELIREGEILN